MSNAPAGNRARQSWQGAFQPSNIDPQFHDFAFIAPADTTQTVAFVPNGSFLQIALQWDEPWGQAATDIDIYLVNANNGNALA